MNNTTSFWTSLVLILATSIVGTSGEQGIDIVKSGDYEGTNLAEPYKTTVLSLSENDNLDDYHEIKWEIKFMPKEDEVWPEYQEKVVKEEVAGHTIYAEYVGGNPVTTISHMFKLPGTYHVKAIGVSTSSRRRLGQPPMKPPKEMRSPLNTNGGSSARNTQFVMGCEEGFQRCSDSNPAEYKECIHGNWMTRPTAGGTVCCEYHEDRIIMVFARDGCPKETVLTSSDIRVRYARRDVIDLSPSDWDNYVDAIWTLKNLSSADGKKRFDCPNFYNIDVFTTMHGVLSHDPKCDQNHFSLMQENAHHAWMTLLERSLQCVHPSIAMPFYNIAKDKRKYFDPTVGAKSMLDSPIFGPDYFGGGAANWDDRADPYDPYYVEDGRFANFPLRQNRTGLCDESAGLFDDDIYIPLCKEILENGGIKAFRSDDPTTSGIWMREPRDDSSYKYVSARRWYLYKDVGDNFIPNFVPSHEMVHAMISTENVVEQYQYVSNAKIHGYAHKVFSGMWGGGIDENTLIPQWSILNKGAPMLETFRKGSGRLVAFAWTDELATRDAGCYQCDKDGCFLDLDNARSLNCYNINNTFGVPVDRTKPVWSEYAEEGSYWYKYLEQMNQASWMKYILYGYGVKHANSGTFGRHVWANQDPLFYAHHAYTFLLNDFGLKNLVEKRFEKPPYYGLDRVIEERGVPECPGQNPTDTSAYRNIVRYKVGEELGVDQTWEQILGMWAEERRDYEWMINDERITNYDETVRYDVSCTDGCIDEALVITNAFPNSPLTLQERCENFVARLQESESLTKKEACAMQLKDIPALGLPFLPSKFDLYSYACKKTCNFCKATCGDEYE